MGVLLSYSITSGIVMLALYLAYRLFMARDKQYAFNRAVLLLIYLMSFLTIPAIAAVERLLGHSAPSATVISGVDITAGLPVPVSKPVWGTVLIWIYLLGMIVVTVKTLITWMRLLRVIRSGEKIVCDRYILVVTDNERYAPFSWMRYVVISRRDYDANTPAIVAHELKHVASRHWVDLMIAQAVCIVNWFNPAAWLMRDELMLVHEYQADMAVIDRGVDVQEYQMLLIKKAVGSRFPSLANSLNHSKLKKRITMMYKEESGAGRRFKALALVPMLAIALGVASVPAVRAAVSTIRSSEISTGEVSEKSSDDKALDQKFRLTNINVDGEKMTVTLMGDDLGDHINVTGGKLISENRTIEAKSIQCQLNNGKAAITVLFEVPEPSAKHAMSLNVNGQELSFNLISLLGNTSDPRVVGFGTKKKEGAAEANTSDLRVVGFGTKKKEGAAEADGDTAAQSGEQTAPDIYIDGKKADQADMNALPVEKIVSVVVDKKNNTIQIITK